MLSLQVRLDKGVRNTYSILLATGHCVAPKAASLIYRNISQRVNTPELRQNDKTVLLLAEAIEF